VTARTRRVLHVGCGYRHERTGQAYEAFRDWEEVRLDIDPAVEPDIVASITNMTMVPDGTFDAVFSRHNLEHLEYHEVPLALREFRRVLKPDGFALIAVPDLQTVAGLIAEGKLEEPFGVSPVGPISPIDTLYGLRSALRDGRRQMAHRTGFVMTTITRLITEVGFVEAGAVRLARTLELWVEARTEPGKPDHLAAILAEDRMMRAPATP
jgi:SAM-dependent methyltransferase